ncbi:uncharacterized protein LOC135334976 [Halichondria panicea]|uniref:uncharacterized protein LOC135334976 n=1 Tax=Halichondria panicea TaxID=6063 RepID=UPI00312B92CF
MATYIAAIVLLSLLLIHFNKGLVTIKFDESQTTIRENDAGEIHVRITGRRPEAISITVTPITFSKFTDPLPSEFLSESLPDPAEVEDFSQDAITLPTFEFNGGTGVFPVDISLIDDDVNERDEGFWLLIEVQNQHNITIERSGLALVIIKDNDPISIGFALPVYETIEQNGLVDDLVFIVKDGNVKSEQVLKVIVMATSGSADMGVDFLTSRLTELVFQPEDEAVSFPFHLYEDLILEEVENFPLFLLLNESQPGLYLDVAVVIIQDNDDADVNECADPSLNSCSSNAMCINSPGGFDCSCPLGFVGEPTVDCQDLDECALDILNNCPDNSECNNIPGSFTCTCTTGFIMQGNLCVDINECAQSPCASIAMCVNTDGSFTCSCPPGFTGDGSTCTDRNECLDPSLNLCTTISTCVNNIGSYSCMCPNGYFSSFDRFGCNDINECLWDILNDCSSTAECSNLPGSFTCSCLPGLIGDGRTCEEPPTTPTPTTSAPTSSPGECMMDSDCGDRASCQDGPFGTTCICNNGFYGDGQHASISTSVQLGRTSVVMTLPASTIWVLTCADVTEGSKKGARDLSVKTKMNVLPTQLYVAHRGNVSTLLVATNVSGMKPPLVAEGRNTRRG